MDDFRISAADIETLETRALPSGIAMEADAAVEVLQKSMARDDLRTTLDAIRMQSEVPALAGGSISNGRLTSVAVTGVREVGHSQAVRQNDRFHLGSNGKAITATLAAVLVERGVIRWETTLGEVFREQGVPMQPAYRTVTLQQLLQHRGGFSTQPTEDRLVEAIVAFEGTPQAGRARFLADLLREPPVTPLGTYNYSNTGYVLAGAMLERQAGQSFERLMERHVFRPLGMTSAGFGAPGRSIRRPDQPRGHTEDGASVGIGRTADLPALSSPAGLMHMNLSDWSRFLRVHLGQRVNGRLLLSGASLARLQTPDPRPITAVGDRYAMGWVVSQSAAGPVLWHDGSNDFWYSQALLVPRIGRAVFAVANQGGAGGIDSTAAALKVIEPNFRSPTNAPVGGAAVISSRPLGSPSLAPPILAPLILAKQSRLAPRSIATLRPALSPTFEKALLPPPSIEELQRWFLEVDRWD